MCKVNDSRIQYPIGVVYGGKVCIEKQLSVRDSLVCLSSRLAQPSAPTKKTRVTMSAASASGTGES